MIINATFSKIDILITDDDRNPIASYQAGQVEYSLDTNMLLKEIGNIAALAQAAGNQIFNPPKPAFVPGEQ